MHLFGVILPLTMARVGFILFFLFCKNNAYHNEGFWRENEISYWKAYDNASDYYPDIAVRQLLDFKLKSPKPIGLLTLSSGAPVEIRDQIGLNSDLMKHDYFFDVQGHLDGESVQPRAVQAKGFGVWGHFEVTNDVSEYTEADVFNGIGKKTTAFCRFAVGSPGTGGTDLGRDIKDISIKLYTEEGILDFLDIHVPLFAFKDPSQFSDFVHAFIRRNPKSNLMDSTKLWDIIILRPQALAFFLYLFSDFGVPNGWRHADYHPIHTYELNNKHGKRWYVRFHWRTNQGFDFLTTEQIQAIADPDYFIRDMYNAIENGTYPSWTLEMDVMSLHNIQQASFDPFDVTRLWKNETYHTVSVGRLTLTRVSDNQFRDAEQAAFNPSNLVPGIPGPVDTLFRGRRFAYRDTQNYRLGRNHHKIGVNSPYYAKNYVRDGRPPVLDNGKDSPNYYPNSFNGPLPYVHNDRPNEDLQVLENCAVNLQEAADLYNLFLDEGGKQRLEQNLAMSLVQTIKSVQKRALKLLKLTSPNLATRTALAIEAIQVANRVASTKLVEQNLDYLTGVVFH